MSVSAAPGITISLDLLTSRICLPAQSPSHKAHRLDCPMITNSVDNRRGPMHCVYYTFGEASMGTKLRSDLGRAGVPLGWLENEGVTSNGSKGNCPEGNYYE
jgi:hypothetical protein